MLLTSFGFFLLCYQFVSHQAYLMLLGRICSLRLGGYPRDTKYLLCSLRPELLALNVLNPGNSIIEHRHYQSSKAARIWASILSLGASCVFFSLFLLHLRALFQGTSSFLNQTGNTISNWSVVSFAGICTAIGIGIFVFSTASFKYEMSHMKRTMKSDELDAAK